VAKKNQGPGIQSAAGLIRYFDAEEKSSIKIPPMFVIFLTAATGVVVVLAHIFWKL
jgi:preprotein translocase subunit Sec61beta